jgi:hypothetical protein
MQSEEMSNVQHFVRTPAEPQRSEKALQALGLGESMGWESGCGRVPGAWGS